jgi:hypothetical protein
MKRFVILLLVTLSTGEANAECAWVAWIKNDLVSTATGRIENEVRWEAHSAFENRSQCNTAQERLWKEAASDAEQVPYFKNLRKHFPDRLSAERPTGSWMKAFYCLPDSVDPRKATDAREQ